MAQHDYSIANQTGLEFRADLNSMAQAIVTQNSGLTEPSNTFPGMVWLDTSVSPPVQKRRNQTNDGWEYDLESSKQWWESAKAALVGPVGITANSTKPALRVTQTGTGHAFVVEDQASDTTPFVIDANGNVGFGTSAPATGVHIVGPQTNSRFAAVPIINFQRAQGSLGSPSAVLPGQSMVQLECQGYDGANFVSGARISADVDGTPGTGSMPGRLVFSTTPPGSGTAVEAMRLTSGQGVQIARTAVTAPTASDGNVFSGTYTPTLTNVTNVSASTASACQYMRVGNVVTVSGRLSITLTAANTNTRVGISLPIASALSTEQQLAGSGGCITGTYYNESGAIIADAANGRADFRVYPPSTASRTYSFTFTYLVA